MFRGEGGGWVGRSSVQAIVRKYNQTTYKSIHQT